MKRMLFAGALLALAPTIAAAQTYDDDPSTWGPSQGDQEVTISGTGTNDKDFETGSFGVSGSYDYFFTDAFQAGVRQTVTWADGGDESSWTGSTRLGMDYNFNLGAFRPFVGLNVGMVYGDGVDETGIIGPEAGVKYYAGPSTFVFLRTEYQYFFEETDDLEGNFDDGAFVHTVGIGFNF